MKSDQTLENKIYTLPDFLQETIGKNIRRERKDKSISQEELAQQLSMSGTAIDQIERGETPLTIEVLDSIAGKLNTTAEELVKEKVSINVNAPMTDSSIEATNTNNNSHNVGVSEEVLLGLTSALNRMCDLIDKKLK